MDRFPGNDFLAKYELVYYDPFEVAIDLGHVQAPEIKNEII